MRRTILLTLMTALLLSIVGVASAQVTENVTTIELPEVVVICPADSVSEVSRDYARLVIEFGSNSASFAIPFGDVIATNNGFVIEVGEFRINCNSASGDVMQVDNTPGIGLNQEPPRPENLPGIVRTQPGHLVVLGDAGNIRTCPSSRCTIAAVAETSQELIVLGHNANFSWWYVQLGDVRGWIWDELVVIRGDVGFAPLVETDVELIQPSVYIGYTGNPLYDVLNLNGNVICPVQGGQEYAWIGRNSDISWVYIEAQCTDGRIVQGWMDAQWVIIRNPSAVEVPLRNADGSLR